MAGLAIVKGLEFLEHKIRVPLDFNLNARFICWDLGELGEQPAKVPCVGNRNFPLLRSTSSVAAGGMVAYNVYSVEGSPVLCLFHHLGSRQVLSTHLSVASRERTGCSTSKSPFA